ncbi:endonuclease NucS [Methanosarcinales archaeon]|nr:MAG: endonuclease NucS [Methanosarcinales archaeon]
MDRIFLAPSSDEVFDFVSREHRQRMIIVAGMCTVEYRGRAFSFLPLGERLVMVKQDGCVIVHRSRGREPVNWMPPGTRLDYAVDDQLFLVHCEKRSSREKMVMEFVEVNLLASLLLNDSGQQSLVGLESDMVDQIVEQPHVLEDGLRIVRREKQTISGSIDLFAIDRDGVPVVVEVKRNPPGAQAVSQLEAYILDFREKNRRAVVRGILCAPRVPRMVRTLLTDKGFEWREFTPIFEFEDGGQRRLDEFI